MSVLLACDFDAAEWAAWRPALDAALAAALPGERVVTDAADGPPAAITVAVVANPPPGALAGLPNLALVHSLWAGVDRLLADATLPPTLPIVRMVDPAMSAAMAETVLWAVLGLHRGFLRYQRLQREARWAPHRQQRAADCRVAVLGLGEMGRTAALRLAQQGYQVHGYSTRATALPGVTCHHEAPRPAGAAAPGPVLDALLAQADVVVNLMPLTDATLGLFAARRLALLPRHAGLVNLARGAHVVEADLLAALDAGALRHAVLDVFATEPLPPGHPFWRHPRVTVLPHAAAQTDPVSASQVLAANLRAWRASGALPQPLVQRARGY